MGRSVHLNGRIYDPFVGRFLSADPEIQDPTHTQSYNRYTYVWNNPTNMTDPTGFEGEFTNTLTAIQTFFAGRDLSKYSDAELAKMSPGDFKANAEFNNRMLAQGKLKTTMGASLQGFAQEVVIQGVTLPVKAEALTAQALARVAAREIVKEEISSTNQAAQVDRTNRTDVRSTESQASKNKNSNDAEGNFGIYEITIDGKTYKIGKADLERITQSSGQPTRLHQQVRKLKEENPAAKVEGEVVEDGHATTGAAKAAETKRLQQYFEKTGEVPPGNQKSFTPQTPPQPEPPKLPEKN